MTREEAADLLDNLIGMVEDNQENDYDEALKMAIEALNVPDTNVGDTISRQAAIDALDEIESEVADGYGYQYEKWRKYFCGLPSAQPEKRTEERTKTHACDLIDRESAVDAIYHHLPSVSRTRARTMLHEVPYAQPEIIRCKDCKWYGRADKRRFYRGTDCLNHRIDTIVPDKDYCSRAERRTDE